MPSLTDINAQQTIDQAISEHHNKISELKERILEHEAAILALNSRRNTHSSISKLPTDLIASIFLYAKHYSESVKRDATSDKNRNWMNISPVCRQWRAIVLDTPQLWCSVDLCWRPECISEFIKRSKYVPLRVRCKSLPYDSGQSEPAAKAVMSQSIYEIDIHVRDLDYLKRFLELNTSGVAPALEVLKVKSFHYDRSTVLPMPWLDVPSLRVLELERIPSFSELPMLPCLTRLLLRPPEPHPLPASWLVQLLRNAPLIEDIEISGLSSDFGAEVPTFPPISLPKLTSLRIRADSFGAAKIFDYIDYHSAIVWYTCFKSPVSDNIPDFASLQHLCSQFASRSKASSPDRLHIDVVGRLLEVTLSPSDTQSPAHLTLRLTLPERPSSLIAEFVQLCSTLPLATAHTLTLAGFRYYPNAEWFTLFPLCQELTSLCLDHCHGIDILVDLLTPSDPLRPPMGKLETLVMRDCTLDYSYAKHYDQIVGAVISILKERKTHGAAIRKLQVDSCKIASNVIGEFEGVVEVHWDGSEVAE